MAKRKRGWPRGYATPVLRIADEATLSRYVERLQAILDTGSHAAQRTFLRAWVARMEADGMQLTVAFTLPGELSGNDAANGSFEGATSSLPPVANGDPKGN